MVWVCISGDIGALICYLFPLYCGIENFVPIHLEQGVLHPFSIQKSHQSHKGDVLLPNENAE